MSPPCQGLRTQQVLRVITKHPRQQHLGQKKPTLEAKQSVVAQPGLPVMAAPKEGVLLALPCYGGGSAQAGGKRVPGRQA